MIPGVDLPSCRYDSCPHEGAPMGGVSCYPQLCRLFCDGLEHDLRHSLLHGALHDHASETQVHAGGFRKSLDGAVLAQIGPAAALENTDRHCRNYLHSQMALGYRTDLVEHHSAEELVDQLVMDGMTWPRQTSDGRL